VSSFEVVKFEFSICHIGHQFVFDISKLTDALRYINIYIYIYIYILYNTTFRIRRLVVGVGVGIES
jgi:hypothetical protein